MVALNLDLQFVHAPECTYFTADERQRFLEAARLAPRPADHTFALTVDPDPEPETPRRVLAQGAKTVRVVSGKQGFGVVSVMPHWMLFPYP